jgi:hypothetical protein
MQSLWTSRDDYGDTQRRFARDSRKSCSCPLSRCSIEDWIEINIDEYYIHTQSI